MSSARLTIEDYAGVTLVTFMDSSLLDSAIIDTIAKDLFHLVDKQNKQKIILDFSSVRLLSSQILGVLTSLHRKCNEIKSSLALCGVRKELMRVFVLTGLDKLLHFYAKDADALAAFGVRVS